jgi:3-deoxy-7-phosphoheptulonate synthase
MTRSKPIAEWHPASWQTLTAAQQPSYPDQAALDRTIADLSRLPPIVTSWEVDGLRDQLARAQMGEAFVLQGGDCAETFDECTSENIVAKLKILLQMSLVMLYGLRKPVVRVGRMAGQYAKPRSANTETRDGKTLPSFRGDLVNRSAFTDADRVAEPQLILRGYERAALTLNFVRSLVDGGFADLHHPEYWDLDWVGHSPTADEYREIVAQISNSLDFLESVLGRALHHSGHPRRGHQRLRGRREGSVLPLLDPGCGPPRLQRLDERPHRPPLFRGQRLVRQWMRTRPRRPTRNLRRLLWRQVVGQLQYEEVVES